MSRTVRVISIIRFTLALIIFTSCQKKQFNNLDDISQFLSDPTNGLTRQKSINGFDLNVKYIPAEFLALKDISKSGTVQEYDSLILEYQKGIYFILNISPSEHKGRGDVMLEGISSYPEYHERFVNLSFHASEMITLSCHSYIEPIQPILSTVIHSYGLTENRQIMFAFENSQDFNQCETVLIEFDDKEFGTGISNYSFSWNDIENFPSSRVNPKL